MRQVYFSWFTLVQSVRNCDHALTSPFCGLQIRRARAVRTPRLFVFHGPSKTGLRRAGERPPTRRRVFGEYVQRLPQTGWWFGAFLFFPYIGNNHPN